MRIMKYILRGSENVLIRKGDTRQKINEPRRIQAMESEKINADV